MARYGQAFKERAVARLLPPESSDVRTLQRWKASAGLVHGDGRPQAIHPTPAHALSQAERAQILSVANEPRFAAVPPARIVPMLVYVLGRWFYLYLILDLYSRKIVGFGVHDTDSADHAAHLVRRTALAEGLGSCRSASSPSGSAPAAFKYRRQAGLSPMGD